ncbi:hypothetical protein HIM_11323 [Hirsutella minnesotensis 3608]|uniref:Yippee/Mis18/Cereblon domain-containing protein n=1 Tax=Hirsutella minnesotensis 3608 TaxID=1043627 RepID=A0A0F7ZWN6_9HYPO|nr:hypothetical protein HIM_11323 [Hirsutella minnesotensis 3608]
MGRRFRVSPAIDGTMNLVTCKCAKCNHALGSILNLWIQIGKRYMTPATHVRGGSMKIITSGIIREGEPHTLVGDCELQDSVCAKCHTTLGQKCLRTPVNHVLHDGQVIFRIASIALKRTWDLRRKVEPRIKRVLPLKKQPPSENERVNVPPTARAAHDSSESKTSETNAPSLCSFEVKAEMAAQREQIGRIGATGMHVIANFETAMSRVDRQLQELRESIERVRNSRDEQHAEIRALQKELLDTQANCQNSPVIERLDQQLQTTDRIVSELRLALDQCRSDTETLHDRLTIVQRNLQEVRDEVANLRTEASMSKQILQDCIGEIPECSYGVSALRREVRQLRAELSLNGEQIRSDVLGVYSSHEIDILSSSIRKIGNRTSQVESLKMEFELFKTRLQRLEARSLASSGNCDKVASTMRAGTISSEADEKSGYDNIMTRKRTLTNTTDNAALNTIPHKRQALPPSAVDSAVNMDRSLTDKHCGISPNIRKMVARTVHWRDRAGSEQYSTSPGKEERVG